MTKKQQQILNSLVERGFDTSYPSGRVGVTVRCSQCEACAINGVACHETGCPNQTHECNECDAIIPRSQRICDSCANEYEVMGLNDEQDDDE